MARKKRSQKIDELEIESLGFEGVSIARKDEMVYMLRGGVPGDIVEAAQRKKKKNRIESQILKVIKASDKRIEPKCIYFGECGGCSWQNISYEDQLYWKQKHVNDAIVRMEKLSPGEIESAMPSKQEFNYRNKMEFSFGASRWMTSKEIESGEEIEQKNFALGLHAKGRFDKVIDIKKCFIHDPIGNEIVNKTRELALEMEMRPYHQRFHDGFLRTLTIRKSNHSNEFLVILKTNEVVDDQQIEFLNQVEKLYAEIFTGSFIHAINTTVNPVNIESQKVIFGSGYLIEDILGEKFKISPLSFFQTNSYQLNDFISEILNYANIKDEETVWDLYCGTGSISLPASRKAKKIIGIELFEGSIEDAKVNAELNGINNCEFYASDLHKKEIPSLLKDLDHPDLVILDPPRAGSHDNLLNHLKEIKPKRIIYVSCNPTTQARDCKKLEDLYRIKKIRPVDMFPQTYHIESIAELELI